MATYNETPLEIIAGAHFNLYRAVVGTSMPLVNAAPSGSWTLVGANGGINYDQGNVSVKKSRAVKEWFGLRSGMPIKAFGGHEGVEVKVTMMDMTLEQLSAALNGNAVTTVAAGSGTAGYKSIELESGLLVTQYALLVRIVSAHFDGLGQYELPIVYQAGEPEAVFKQDEPVGVALTFRALRHASLGAGKLVMQTAAPL